MTRINRTANLLVTCALLLSGVARAADPTTADCLSANDKSIAMRNQHALRAARAELLICAAESCPTDVRNECARRVAEVNAAMPTVVFEAKSSTGADLSAVKVTMDGQQLADRLEGTALSIDPGEHTFVFETEGQPAITKQFVIVEGLKDRRERIVLGAVDAVAHQAPVAGTPVSTAVASSGVGSPLGADTLPSSSAGDVQRILGWTGVGLGAAGLTVGIVFAAQRSSKLSERDALCPGGTCTGNQQKRDQVNALTSDARSASTVSTIGFVAGGLLAAGGLVAIFTAPKAEARPGRLAVLPVVAPGVQGAVLSATLW